LPAKPNSALFQSLALRLAPAPWWPSRLIQPLEVTAFSGAGESGRKFSPPSKYLLKSHARNTAVSKSANGADMMT
jgi:hypothetical protein